MLSETQLLTSTSQSPGLSKLDFPPVGEGELIISGLPSNTEDVDLYRLFAPQGAILDASVAKDSLGKCKGMLFIYVCINVICIKAMDILKWRIIMQL
jgi:RNA recognition motif-containing protein